MKAHLCLLAAGLAAAISAPQAQAHHAFHPQFDAAAPVELSGTVISTDWRNPHAVIHLAGSDAGGPAGNWLVEADAPGNLLRLGIGQATLAAGTTLIVRGFRATGCPARPGRVACKVDGRALIFENGRTVSIGVADCGPRDTVDPAVSHPCLGEGAKKTAH